MVTSLVVSAIYAFRGSISKVEVQGLCWFEMQLDLQHERYQLKSGYI